MHSRNPPALARRRRSASHALRLGGALFALSVAAFVIQAGCASSGVNQGDLNLVSQPEEWQVGQRLENDLSQQLDLVTDRRIVDAVSSMGQRIVAQTELSSAPWEFHVVRDAELNAFNIPGGHVYVNTGLIASADNASELAGVMAHEIAHGVARHGTENLTRSYGLNIVASLALGENPELYQQLLAQVAGTGAMARFSRDAEREADQLGIRYMHGAGFDPQGMAAMFEELLANRQRRPSAVEQFFATHPLTEDRIAAVRTEAQRLPRQGVQSDTQSFRSLRARVTR